MAYDILKAANLRAWSILHGQIPLFATNTFVATMPLIGDQKVTYLAQYAGMAAQANLLRYYDLLGFEHFLNVAPSGAATVTTKAPTAAPVVTPSATPVTTPSAVAPDAAEGDTSGGTVSLFGQKIPILALAAGGIAAGLVFLGGRGEGGRR